MRISVYLSSGFQELALERVSKSSWKFIRQFFIQTVTGSIHEGPATNILTNAAVTEMFI